MDTKSTYTPTGETSRATPPWEGYDTATVGQIMNQLVNTNDDGRALALAYERRKKNRKNIIWILVNWNS